MVAPVFVGMGVGALTALAMGKDPLMGAAVGGASGGMFGGAGGFGSGFTTGATAATSSGITTAGTTTLGTSTGTALGQGGMNTAAGQGLLGATPSFASVGAPQIGSVVTPENTPNLLMDSAYNAPISPTDAYTGDLSMMASDNLGGATTMGVDNPNLYTGGGYDPAIGPEQLNYRPDFTPIAGTNDGGGGYEYDFLDTFKISDYTPSNEVLNQTTMGMGINALSPEQQQRLQHQQAQIMRGEIPTEERENVFGRQYISRA
jgi:hypothetical protein